MRQKPVAFMSYAHVDNQYGQLTEFRERLSNEVHVQIGEEFPIFQDREDILWGQKWRQRIEQALEEEITFLIPIITPSFFNSKACREELEIFLERERALKRSDLILPVYYVNCRTLYDETLRANDSLAEAIASRQWVDWRGLRFEPFTSPQVGKSLMQLAGQIYLALERLATSLIEEEIAPRGGGDGKAKALGKPGLGGFGKAQAEVEIFYAYSHTDERLREQLEKHLALLKRQGLIAMWHDRRVGNESGWSGEIDSHINSAQIILFLISADFLSSDYCYDIEVKRALNRHESGEAFVIPIILRACDWGGTPFAKLQALPKAAKPVVLWKDRDEAFLDIAKGIKEAARSFMKKHGVA